jgi:hypothetical protein
MLICRLLQQVFGSWVRCVDIRWGVLIYVLKSHGTKHCRWQERY